MGIEDGIGIGEVIQVDGSSVTQPISASSLPLPTGAATETTLSAINTKIPASPSQEHTTAGSPTSTRLSDGSSFYNALTDTQLRASAVTVTANAGTNLNTSALALEATQVTQNTRIGDLTETAPASDTASSGLNGRLQRIAQRLTSIIALLPSSIGQKAMSDSLSVAVASNQSAIPVVGNIASASTDSGNPVKIGAKYNSTLPTFTDGQRSDLQANSRGQIYISELYSHRNITGATTVTVKSGAGFLKRISINRPINGTWTFYDNTTATGTPIFVVAGTNGTAPTTLEYGFEFTTGLTVNTTGTNTDLSIIYL